MNKYLSLNMIKNFKCDAELSDLSGSFVSVNATFYENANRVCFKILFRRLQ